MNYAKYLIFYLTASLPGALTLSKSQVVAVSFGNPPSTVDMLVTDFASINQNASEVDLVGTAANMVAITFPAVDITGLHSVILRAAVTDSITEPNPNVYILIELFDSSLNTLAFDTYSNLYSTSPTDVVLVYNPIFSSSTFDYTDLIAFQLTAGGLHIDPLHITLYQVSFIIPEPAQMIILIGLCLIAAVTLKVRKKALTTHR